MPNLFLHIKILREALAIAPTDKLERSWRMYDLTWAGPS
jgi:hypothetical protein